MASHSWSRLKLALKHCISQMHNKKWKHHHLRDDIICAQTRHHSQFVAGKPCHDQCHVGSRAMSSMHDASACLCLVITETGAGGWKA